MQEEQEVVKKQKSNFVRNLILFLLTLAIGAGGMAYGITQYPKILGLSKGQAQTQTEIDVLLTSVGKLIALPSDEKPTIATVSDVEKIKDQPFFKNALNGDKVLIYTKAKKAILYRPSENKVVEVGAVNINQQAQPSGSPLSTASPTPTTSLRGD